MPKYNPKHNKLKRYRQQPIRKLKRFPISRHHLMMIIIGSVVVIGMVALTIYIVKNKSKEELFVEIGDTIDVKYTLWLSDENGGYVTKLQTGELKSLVMKSTANETGLIWGFWNALLYMYLNQTKNIYLKACIDDNISWDFNTNSPVNLDPNCIPYDGWDDRYPIGTQRAESYGYNYTIKVKDEYENEIEYNLRFKPLRFRIEVTSIKKEAK